MALQRRRFERGRHWLAAARRHQLAGDRRRGRAVVLLVERPSAQSSAVQRRRRDLMVLCDHPSGMASTSSQILAPRHVPADRIGGRADRALP
jgi:hypothetical protein